MKKLGRFLSSMGFAVALLVLLAAACALSSLVEQGLTREAYEVRYGSGMASVIMALQVNDAYHSVWFIALSGFLCLNLLPRATLGKQKRNSRNRSSGRCG